MLVFRLILSKIHHEVYQHIFAVADISKKLIVYTTFFAFLTVFSAYLLQALTSASNLSKISCFMLNLTFFYTHISVL